MTTAKEVVTDALEDIFANAAEESIDASDGQAALRYLNDMMFMWDAKGISLGYTRITNLGKELTVPDGAIFGIKRLLSVSLAPKFGGEVSSIILQEAKEGWDAILDLTWEMSSMNYPSDLPVGSGWSNGTFRAKYYPELDEAILTETSGFISVEDET